MKPPVTLTPQNIVNGRMYIREEGIVWLHQQRMGGTVIGHTKGTIAVDQAVDQVMHQMFQTPAKFTMDDGNGGTTVLYVAVPHILMVLQVGTAVRIKLTRGEFEVNQNIKTVTRWLMND